MENKLLTPNDKIYIIPTNQRKPVKIVFENDSSITTADYNDIVSDRNLRVFIGKYTLMDSSKMEYTELAYECVCESLL